MFGWMFFELDELRDFVVANGVVLARDDGIKIKVIIISIRICEC